MRGEWIRTPKGSAVVVFVHGILSSGDSCWRNANGVCWPNLLVAEPDLADMGVYVYTYSTSFFSGSYRLGDVVDDLKERLKLDGITQSTKGRRIVFVCHSMGGIVVRKLLVERAGDFIEQLIAIGLFLVASPSLGSLYATWLSPLAQLLGHSQAKALRFSQNNEWLSDLDKEFQNLKESGRIPMCGKELIEDKFVIVKRWWRRQVVEPPSGARYFGERLKIPESDHFSIAKPANSHALQHRTLCQFIKSVIETSSSPVLAKPDEHGSSGATSPKS